MKITLVKKIKADGSECRKCAEVNQRLKDAGLMSRIDEVVIADERDADSPGMQLAARLKVDRAPFFIVSGDDGEEHVYTVYFRFLKEVLQAETSAKDEAAEILDQNPDLDYI